MTEQENNTLTDIFFILLFSEDYKKLKNILDKNSLNQIADKLNSDINYRDNNKNLLRK